MAAAAGGVTIYKNGQVVATGTSGIPRNLTRTSNFLGKSNWPDAMYSGGMDEVAFYDHSLTAQTIQDHYKRRHYGDVKIEHVNANNELSTISASTSPASRCSFPRSASSS